MKDDLKDLNFFSLRNFKDLIDKIEFQFSSFDQLSIKRENIYLLWDIVLSLNHLPEWVINDNSVSYEFKVQCLKVFNPFSSIDSLHKDSKFKKIILESGIKNWNEKQKNIRDLANSIKHFKVKKIEESKIEPSYLTCGDTRMFCGSDVAVAGYHDKYKFVLEIDGKEIDVHRLIYDLLSQWIHFKEEYIIS